MAYTEVSSNEIPEGTQYYSGKLPLGDYNFYLKIDATGVSPKIIAQRVSPDGEIRTSASRTWPSGTQVKGWSVEANETEASVYANIAKYTAKCVGPSATTGQTFATGNHREQQRVWMCANADDPALAGVVYIADGNWMQPILIGTAASNVRGYCEPVGDMAVSARVTINGVDFVLIEGAAVHPGEGSASGADLGSYPNDNAAITALVNRYFEFETDSEPVLVARFATNLGDAGGYPGGGGGWISPGDWNPDPTTTLHLTVNGALSGRHNDPLTDPSYSYVPADNTAEAGYGCGGDGGNGGGGGAGASTIIVRQFATNKANYKDIVALAKRHGYGSGGGKGGKGGDGCILIYY